MNKLTSSTTYLHADPKIAFQALLDLFDEVGRQRFGTHQTAHQVLLPVGLLVRYAFGRYQMLFLGGRKADRMNDRIVDVDPEIGRTVLFIALESKQKIVAVHFDH